ncbi:unnamed protein product [Acanthosepion pharaonis]|uniref:Uncharacterized protein n=1 Tax=Acanthosepion pharaonis TaxID=158019 RepID=A0A812C1B6_ACAPH|nr:unnamed protein product [Sepia pharaonis]
MTNIIKILSIYFVYLLGRQRKDGGFPIILLSTQLQVTSSSSVLQLFSPRSELFSLPSEVNSSLCLPGLNCSACLACNLTACLACNSSAYLACSSSAYLACNSSACLACSSSAYLACNSSACLACNSSACLACSSSAYLACNSSACLACNSAPTSLRLSSNFLLFDLAATSLPMFGVRWFRYDDTKETTAGTLIYFYLCTLNTGRLRPLRFTTS